MDPIVVGSIRLAVFSSTVLYMSFSGGYGEEETPVPIPNTAVKLFSADGTAWATAWESRSPPGVISRPVKNHGSFFVGARPARCKLRQAPEVVNG